MTATASDTLPRCYEMGFFEGNGLLHPEVELPPMGYSGTPLPYQLRHDDGVTALVVLCFFLVLFVARRVSPALPQLSRAFLFPTRRTTSSDTDSPVIDGSTTWLMRFLISMMGGLLAFVHAQADGRSLPGWLSPYALMALYIGIWLAAFVAKGALGGFVNWIFFDKTQKDNWRQATNYLVLWQSIVAFVLIVVSVYFDVSLQNLLWIILILLTFEKIIRFCKAFLIFFETIASSLHLLLYFCTLEVVPLLVTVRLITLVTDLLTVKY